MSRAARATVFTSITEVTAIDLGPLVSDSSQGRSQSSPPHGLPPPLQDTVSLLPPHLSQLNTSNNLICLRHSLSGQRLPFGFKIDFHHKFAELLYVLEPIYHCHIIFLDPSGSRIQRSRHIMAASIMYQTREFECTFCPYPEIPCVD